MSRSRYGLSEHVKTDGAFKRQSRVGLYGGLAFVNHRRVLRQRMDHCLTLASQGPIRARGREEEPILFTVNSLSFTQRPICWNRQLKFQAARSLSSVDSDRSSKTSTERVRRYA
jgi:hypothetical protein